MNETITRKELASKIGVSTRTVERHERQWGLNEALCPLSERPRLYFVRIVNRQLRMRGLIQNQIQL